MALRPEAVGHNLDFPETDSDLACAKDVFLTTYILARALLITFQTLACTSGYFEQAELCHLWAVLLCREHRV